MRRLSPRVNVIPVIGKSDSFTPSELRAFKKRVMEDIGSCPSSTLSTCLRLLGSSTELTSCGCADHYNIAVYNFPYDIEEDDEETCSENQELRVRRSPLHPYFSTAGTEMWWLPCPGPAPFCDRGQRGGDHGRQRAHAREEDALGAHRGRQPSVFLLFPPPFPWKLTDLAGMGCCSETQRLHGAEGRASFYAPDRPQRGPSSILPALSR